MTVNVRSQAKVFSLARDLLVEVTPLFQRRQVAILSHTNEDDNQQPKLYRLLQKLGAFSGASRRRRRHRTVMTPFRLLDLPAELWIEICAFGLAKAYSSTLYLHEDMHPRTLQALTQPPALLQTCKAIRAEGIPLLYAETTFLLIEANMHSPYWRLWLEALAPDTRRHMTRLFVTSTHQDVITHLRSNHLLPPGAETHFAEPTGSDGLPLCDFTYQITLPKHSEPDSQARAEPQKHDEDSELAEAKVVRRGSHLFRKLAMASLWQARRGKPAKGRWL